MSTKLLKPVNEFQRGKNGIGLNPSQLWKSVPPKIPKQPQYSDQQSQESMFLNVHSQTRLKTQEQEVLSGASITWNAWRQWQGAASNLPALAPNDPYANEQGSDLPVLTQWHTVVKLLGSESDVCVYLQGSKSVPKEGTHGLVGQGPRVQTPTFQMFLLPLAILIFPSKFRKVWKKR